MSNLVIRNGLIRNKLVLRNHFSWPIVNLLHKDKEHLALRNNFRVTKKFLITKFDCISKDWIFFSEFLPSSIPFVIQIEGDQLDLSLFVPEVYTSHDILKSLDLNAKLVNKDGGKCHWKRDGMDSKWRNMCSYEVRY